MKRSNSDDESKPRITAVKKGKASTTAPKKALNTNETIFELGNKRRLVVNLFQEKPTIAIREYYEADGQLLPGKRGINLKLSEWDELLNQLAEIGRAVDELR